MKLNGIDIAFRRVPAVVLSNQVRAESRTSGGGRMTDGSGDVRVETTVTTRQDMLVREEDTGTERRISTINEELVCREGSRLDLIHAVLPCGTDRNTHILNTDTNDRRVLKNEAAALCVHLTSKLPRTLWGWLGFAALFVLCAPVGLWLSSGLLGWIMGLILTGIASFAARAALNWGRYVSSPTPWMGSS